jgi:hypothetical protein
MDRFRLTTILPLRAGRSAKFWTYLPDLRCEQALRPVRRRPGHALKNIHPYASRQHTHNDSEASHRGPLGTRPKI